MNKKGDKLFLLDLNNIKIPSKEKFEEYNVSRDIVIESFGRIDFYD